MFLFMTKHLQSWGSLVHQVSSTLFRVQFGDFLITGGSALGGGLAPKGVSFAHGSCPRKERGWGLQNLLPLKLYLFTVPIYCRCFCQSCQTYRTIHCFEFTYLLSFVDHTG